jgi:hypothetical protein
MAKRHKPQTIRVDSPDGESCIVAFEPWGNEYRLVSPDSLTIELHPDDNSTTVVYSDGRIEFWLGEEPTKITNGRGESVSV